MGATKISSDATVSLHDQKLAILVPKNSAHGSFVVGVCFLGDRFANPAGGSAGFTAGSMPPAACTAGCSASPQSRQRAAQLDFNILFLCFLSMYLFCLFPFRPFVVSL